MHRSSIRHTEKYMGHLVIILLILFGLTALYSAITPNRMPARPINPAVETAAAQKVLAAQIAIAAQVELKAKPWNNGYVHVWIDLNESSATFVDIPENTNCQRLDDAIYKIGSGSTTIRYYKLICNGTTGYVEIDQVR